MELSCQLCSYSWTSQHFMEPEGSLTSLTAKVGTNFADKRQSLGIVRSQTQATEFFLFVCLKIHYHGHKSPSLVPVLSQINTVYAVPSHLWDSFFQYYSHTYVSVSLVVSFLLAFPPISHFNIFLYMGPLFYGEFADFTILHLQFLYLYSNDNMY
jgi:hypothetical protein